MLALGVGEEVGLAEGGRSSFFSGVLPSQLLLPPTAVNLYGLYRLSCHQNRRKPEMPPRTDAMVSCLIPPRTRIRPFSVLIVVCLAAMMPACLSPQSKEAVTLEAAQGQASQEEIRRQLGEPTTTRSLEGGRSFWTYEKREQQSGSRYSAPGMWCSEYALTFDEQGILRHWTQRTYFHGGELMPKECIPG